MEETIMKYRIFLKDGLENIDADDFLIRQVHGVIEIRKPNELTPYYVIPLSNIKFIRRIE